MADYLNITANAFAVPLAIGDDAKRAAIAIRVLEESGYDDVVYGKAAAQIAVDHVLELAVTGRLDEVLARTEKLQRSMFVNMPQRGEGEEMETNLRPQLGMALVEKLVEHLKDYPRDVGKPAVGIGDGERRPR